MTLKKTKEKRIELKKKRKKASLKAGSYSKKNKSLKLLEKITGIGQGLWNEDAQKYINSLRD